MGQRFGWLRTPDPRLIQSGTTLDFCLQCQLKVYLEGNAPPCRVNPISIALAMHALEFAFDTRPTKEYKAVANIRGGSNWNYKWRGKYNQRLCFGPGGGNPSSKLKVGLALLSSFFIKECVKFPACRRTTSTASCRKKSRTVVAVASNYSVQNYIVLDYLNDVFIYLLDLVKTPR